MTSLPVSIPTGTQSQQSAVLIAGIGSHHGDDQAGWLAIEIIRSQLQPGLSDTPFPIDAPLDSVREIHSRFPRVLRLRVPLDLLDQLDGVSDLHLLDACRGNHPAGHLHRIRWTGTGAMAAAGPETCAAAIASDALTQSVHGFGLSEVLRLADTLGLLPSRVTLWLIESGTCGTADEPSIEVQCGARAAAAALLAALQPSEPTTPQRSLSDA